MGKQIATGILLLATVVAPSIAVAEDPVKPSPPVVELRAVGMQFEGPREIPSGWTTFRFHNASPMIHFALLDVPPEGVDVQRMSRELVDPFQVLMNALNAGDKEAADAALATFPEWVGELGHEGGPGLLSPGLTGQATIRLEPGEYVVECYVKTNGVFHSTSPGDGQLGMLLPLTVTAEDNGAAEPTASAVLAVTTGGFELVAGRLVAGPNTIRVNFVEQEALPSFVGYDVHLLRVDSPESLALADAWMDWRTRDGLQDPAPVQFLGGIEELPAGAHGYFSVDLDPGDYAFIAEIPVPMAAGFTLPFTVE